MSGSIREAFIVIFCLIQHFEADFLWMESQPHNLEFKNYPESFHSCVHCHFIYLDCSHYQLTASALLSALGLALLSVSGSLGFLKSEKLL